MKNKIYIIANWKMQLNKSDSVRLSVEIAKDIKTKKQKSKKTTTNDIEIILCPSFVHLSDVARKVKDSSIKLGAQDVFYEDKGQYTGEISAVQLKEFGVKYVIVGHSERRQHLGETGEEINLKVKTCLKNDLVPIICLGETWQERKQNETDLVLIKQLKAVLQGVDLHALKEAGELLIAYEPIWAIGSGRSVNASEAEHAAQVIKHSLADFFEEKVFEKNISIIYGGSVDAENVKDFIKIGFLDGVLVGGASLSSEKFLGITKEVISNQ